MLNNSANLPCHIQRSAAPGLVVEPDLGKKLTLHRYPCTRWASGEVSRIKTIQKTEKSVFAALIHYARQGYGPLINIMVKKGIRPEKIIERLIRAGTPARLKPPITPEIKDPLFPEGVT